MFHVERAQELFAAAGLKAPDGFLLAALQHLEEVYRWNRVHDLTAIPPEEAIEKHLLDSILPFAAVTPPGTLLDVGTGAGFPGIPLALWWPRTQVTLLEPLRKRRSFLETVCARLDLQATVRGEVVEKLTGETWDLVTSRATLPWRVLLSAAGKCVVPGGLLVGLLGPEQAPVKGELAALQAGEGDWESLNLVPYSLPSGAQRVAMHGVRRGAR